jgi:hypothetical protein
MAKRSIPAAAAELLPATAQRDEHGYVVGKVSYISDYPATPQALLATLGSEELVKELASVSAPFEVTDSPRQSRWQAGLDPRQGRCARPSGRHALLRQGNGPQ